MEKAINRQRVLLEHLCPSSSFSHQGLESSLSASVCLAGDSSAAYHRTASFGDDVVIVAAYRTAICKSKRGGFKDTLPDDLLSPVLKALIEKTNLNPNEVGDIVVGTVLAPGSQRATECRMAAFYAGFPETVPIRTVNRQCSSGLQAVADVAASIRAGFYDIGIGAGLESMTADMIGRVPKVNPRVDSFAQARDCLLPMGITSENVAQRYGVTRQEQDQAAMVSHECAAAATASGKFTDEIIPVSTKIVDPRSAGNASQVSDAAGAVLLMKRSLAMQKGLPILGVFRSFAAVEVDPDVVGIGPAAAIPLLLGLILLAMLSGFKEATSHGDQQPLSRIAIHKAVFALDDLAYIKASPPVLGLEGKDSEWLTVEYSILNPSIDDWIGVFSPANFSASTCALRVFPPLLCTAPIKYQYANYANPEYKDNGKGSLRLQLINQRSDFSFALFSGGLLAPKLVAVSNIVAFANPNAPVYPRLAQGKTWNEMTVTWTSGYGINEAEPFVQWGPKGREQSRSPAGTVTFDRSSMCGAPARTVGWRDPGFIHTSFLKDLWPNSVYTYKIGHMLLNGTYIWTQMYQFRASPYPGQNSIQRVVIYGDMGKDEADGSSEYNNFQRGSLNTTKQLIKDLKNIDIVFHIGDICYANGYISQWDQFTSQIEPIASTVPYMIASGNHERDWPGTGSFYGNMDSGGECGVLAETMFYVPTENRAKFWYSTNYGMFKFCIADTEQDWREGSEQYVFIEHCLASVDRLKQPWLIFLAHRVLGYSSDANYALEGSFAEPMGRDSLQKLWQKYKVDIAMFGHVHNYERTCPIYQNICTNKEKHYYKGPLNGTIHVVAGGAGASLSPFTTIQTHWSIFKDFDYGFVKLTAFDHSNLLFEYKKSRDGNVYDSFRISRGYRDILACTVDSCPSSTLAS